MIVSYKKLWKLLIDRNIKKKELCRQAGVSVASITKMGNNGTVTTTVIAKICMALNCTPNDIMDIVWEDKEDD